MEPCQNKNKNEWSCRPILSLAVDSLAWPHNMSLHWQLVHILLTKYMSKIGQLSSSYAKAVNRTICKCTPWRSPGCLYSKNHFKKNIKKKKKVYVYKYSLLITLQLKDLGQGIFQVKFVEQLVHFLTLHIGLHLAHQLFVPHGAMATIWHGSE